MAVCMPVLPHRPTNRLSHNLKVISILCGGSGEEIPILPLFIPMCKVEKGSVPLFCKTIEFTAEKPWRNAAKRLLQQEDAAVF